jgi:hypothetical protein
MSGASLGFIQALLLQNKHPQEVLTLVKEKYPSESPADLELLVQNELELISGEKVTVPADLTFAETLLLDQIKIYIQNQLATNKSLAVIKADAIAIGWAKHVVVLAIAQVQ